MYSSGYVPPLSQNFVDSVQNIRYHSPPPATPRSHKKKTPRSERGIHSPRSIFPKLCQQTRSLSVQLIDKDWVAKGREEKISTALTILGTKVDVQPDASPAPDAGFVEIIIKNDSGKKTAVQHLKYSEGEFEVLKSRVQHLSALDSFAIRSGKGGSVYNLTEEYPNSLACVLSHRPEDISLDGENITVMLSLADKYIIDDVKQCCEKFLCANAQVDDADLLYDIADRFHLEKLKQISRELQWYKHYIVPQWLKVCKKGLSFREIESLAEPQMQTQTAADFVYERLDAAKTVGEKAKMALVLAKMGEPVGKVVEDIYRSYPEGSDGMTNLCEAFEALEDPGASPLLSALIEDARFTPKERAKALEALKFCDPDKFSQTIPIIMRQAGYQNLREEVLKLADIKDLPLLLDVFKTPQSKWRMQAAEKLTSLGSEEVFVLVLNDVFLREDIEILSNIIPALPDHHRVEAATWICRKTFDPGLDAGLCQILKECLERAESGDSQMLEAYAGAIENTFPAKSRSQSLMNCFTFLQNNGSGLNEELRKTMLKAVYKAFYVYCKKDREVHDFLISFLHCNGSCDFAEFGKFILLLAKLDSAATLAVLGHVLARFSDEDIAKTILLALGESSLPCAVEYLVPYFDYSKGSEMNSGNGLKSIAIESFQKIMWKLTKEEQSSLSLANATDSLKKTFAYGLRGSQIKSLRYDSRSDTRIKTLLALLSIKNIEIHSWVVSQMETRAYISKEFEHFVAIASRHISEPKLCERLLSSIENKKEIFFKENYQQKGSLAETILKLKHNEKLKDRINHFLVRLLENETTLQGARRIVHCMAEVGVCTPADMSLLDSKLKSHSRS